MRQVRFIQRGGSDLASMSAVRWPRRGRLTGGAVGGVSHAVAAMIAIFLALSPALAGEGLKCRSERFVLWGDGNHDDTAGLNAWFRGDNVVWAQTGHPVGAAIGGSEAGDRTFRLTGPVYIPSGTGRRIDRFEFVWPERKERVAGGTIVGGRDP